MNQPISKPDIQKATPKWRKKDLLQIIVIMVITLAAITLMCLDATNIWPNRFYFLYFGYLGITNIIDGLRRIKNKIKFGKLFVFLGVLVMICCLGGLTIGLIEFLS